MWGKSDDNEAGELTVSSLRLMNEEQQQSLLFKAIRACDLHAIRSILQVNRTLLTAKMFGYEGTDVFDVIKNSKTKRCYSYTGLEKDGFFYPLHVAGEAGHKNLIILLVKAGADINAIDYRGCKAEDKCNGNAIFAFYELKGMKFEAKERYVGKTNRQGERHGTGVIYYKPEGYMMEEKQLYRGSFKHNLYHGHGVLYYPGTETIAYTGRFKEGMKHGRGLEFDLHGQKIYHGTFRDDKREGHGEEYGENLFLTYRGEFSNGARHGFGAAYFPEHSRYFGRFENNLMSGVGIYVHPDQSRFEGMFFNNKPDGPGSYYEKDSFTGHFSGSHALWQGGKKVKETNTPFLPTYADLPDDTSKSLFTEIMAGHNKIIGSLEDDEDDDNVDFNNNSDTFNTTSSSATQRKQQLSTSFTYFNIDAHLATLNKSDYWKVQLGKYMKLSLSEAPYLGIQVPNHLLAQIYKKHSHDEADDDADGENKHRDEDEVEEEEDDEHDLDEVIGYHFMACTTLFAAYVYVTSASKVFEDRLVNKELRAEFPDFEAVYHLVIDAVDNYNEDWEEAFRVQQQQQQMQLSASLATASTDETANHNNNNASMMEARRMMFMTEKEKKAELIVRQRAELAIKKGTAELDPKLEKHIATAVLTDLETELTKLLNEGIEEKVHMNLPIARKQGMSSSSAAAAVDELLQSPATNKASHTMHSSSGGEGKGGSNGKKGTAPDSGGGNSKKIGGNTINKKDAPNNGNINNKAGGKASTPNRNDNNSNNAHNIVNLDDLFDIDNFSSNAALFAVDSEAGSANDNNDEEQVASNEFAAELLYIMRLSMSLT